MAKNKMILGMALGGIVLLVLFLFTREGMQPDRKSRPAPRPAVQSTQVKPAAKPRPRMNRQARQAAIKAKRRAAVVKAWAGMTQEQRQAFMKKHPNFKPPANVPPATTAKPVTTAPGATQPKAATAPAKTAPATVKTQPATGTATQKKTN